MECGVRICITVDELTYWEWHITSNATENAKRATMFKKPNDPAIHTAPAGVQETGSGDNADTYQHNSYQLNTEADSNR